MPDLRTWQRSSSNERSSKCKGMVVPGTNGQKNSEVLGLTRYYNCALSGESGVAMCFGHDPDILSNGERAKSR